jgi:hypothetical protein
MLTTVARPIDGRRPAALIERHGDHTRLTIQVTCASAGAIEQRGRGAQPRVDRLRTNPRNPRNPRFKRPRHPLQWSW